MDLPSHSVPSLMFIDQLPIGTLMAFLNHLLQSSFRDLVVLLPLLFGFLQTNCQRLTKLLVSQPLLLDAVTFALLKQLFV